MDKFASKLPDDCLVCCFNKDIHKNSFSSHKQKYIFLNAADDFFWGYEKNLHQKYKKVYFSIPYNQTLKSVYKKCSFKNKNIMGKPIEIDGGYPKMPTIGLQTVGFLLNERPDLEIILVNFTGKGWKGHDWEREQAIYKELGIKKISVN